MKLSSLLLVLSIGMLTFSQAADAQAPDSWTSLETLDGKTFNNAKLSKIEPDGIRIVHDEGFAKIQYEQLSEDLRKSFNFNEQQASAFREHHEKKQQEALKTGETIRKELHQKEAELVRLQSLHYTRQKFEIYKVLPEGLICVPCGGLAAHSKKQRELQAASGSLTPLTETMPEQAFWITRAGKGWAEGDLLHTLMARAGAQEVNERTLPWLVCKN